MRKCMRAFDLIYRLGGEEFMVLLPGADLEGSRLVAERLREAVFEANPGGIEVSISLGVTIAQPGQTSFRDLFEIADAGPLRGQAPRPQPRRDRGLDAAARLAGSCQNFHKAAVRAGGRPGWYDTLARTAPMDLSLSARTHAPPVAPTH